MRYVEVEGLRASRIGLGTWQIGSREWGYGEAYATEVAPALVRRAVELGITMIDTAEIYGLGRSERVIGATLGTIDAAGRDSLVIATKFLPVAPAAPIVAWQAEGSRRRLGVDSLDLFYAHWPNPFVSPRRVMQSIRPLVSDGVVRRVAVSNHTLEQWRAAERSLGAPVIANQVPFSLLRPGAVHDLVPHAARNDRLIVAYSPLGQGLLAGSSGDATRGMRSLDPRFRPAGRERLAPLLDAIVEVAIAHGATPAQVGLAWLLHHPSTVAIPGARTVAQLEENAAAADIELSATEFARLSEVSSALADRRRT